MQDGAKFAFCCGSSVSGGRAGAVRYDQIWYTVGYLYLPSQKLLTKSPPECAIKALLAFIAWELCSATS